MEGNEISFTKGLGPCVWLGMIFRLILSYSVCDNMVFAIFVGSIRVPLAWGGWRSSKFPTFCGSRRFITTFTSARHLSLSWASSIQSTPPYPTSWRSILILSSHLRLGLPSGLFSSGFPTKVPWVPVTKAWCVPSLRVEERPPIWRVAANILNKLSRTADKGWSSSLGLGEVLTSPRRKNWLSYETWTLASVLGWHFGTT